MRIIGKEWLRLSESTKKTILLMAYGYWRDRNRLREMKKLTCANR